MKTKQAVCVIALFAVGITSTILIPTTDAVASSSLTVLVNKQHPLVPKSYTPAGLVFPAVYMTPNNISEDRLRQPAASALEHMFRAAQRDAGISFVLSSGYRSYADQSQLYQTAGGGLANEVVAPPGYSEHQTGLAADIILSNYYCAAQTCFAMTRAAAWLAAHSYEYGFVSRYPNYTKSITGYEYEPWHYRYLGSALAKELHDTGATLERYYGHM